MGGEGGSGEKLFTENQYTDSKSFVGRFIMSKRQDLLKIQT